MDIEKKSSMNISQSPRGVSVKASPGQDALDSGSTTAIRPSNDEIELGLGEDESPPSGVRRLKLSRSPSPDNKKKIKIELEEEANQNIPSPPATSDEEMDSDNEKGLLKVQEDSPGVKEEPEEAKDGIKEEVKEESKEVKDESEGDSDSSETSSIDQLVALPVEKASSWSPYCYVMEDPSWKFSPTYHKARGPMLILHLKDTEAIYKVHRTLILSKIPELPLIYHDLEDDDENEHTLDEPLHNVNLMIYWVYHEELPPRVKIKRDGTVDGRTWDRYELAKFALRIRALELLKCINQ